MPVTILKRKHSLKGKNIFPLLKKVKDTDNISNQMARLASQQRTEEMDATECKRAFKEITGEDADEFLDMAGKVATENNCRILLHLTIIEANKNGQSGQVPVAPEAGTSAGVSREDDSGEEDASTSKKKKIDVTLEKRIEMLEKSQDSVESLKDKVHLETIDERLSYLDNIAMSSKNIKRKEQLKENLEKFLLALPESKAIHNASPDDIKRFLDWKDGFGKTKVHEITCKFLGMNDKTDCCCPIRMASASVANIVQELMDIFYRGGRGRSFNEFTNQGNPAASSSVKMYLKCIKEEQAKAHVLPKQAKPIFLSKLESISEYIDNRLKFTDLSLTELYVLARDQALFKMQFFAGDSASDVGVTMGQEIKILEDGSGFLVNHTYGKTLRGDGKCNIFVLKKCDRKTVCPVEGIKRYLSVATSMGISLGCGYLFRPVSDTGIILNEPLTYSAIYERLREYLSRLGIYEGETPHSFRAGCAVHMLMSNSAESVEAVKNHIGWSSDSSARYYSREVRVKDANIVADKLAQSASSTKVESNFSVLSKFKDVDH